MLAALGGAEPVRVTVDAGHPVGRSRLALGVTHTQYSLDSWGDRRAIARGVRLLRFARFQNQHLYGWGTRNPQPAPGDYAWRTLDRRVAMMRRVGAEPVITLCCAPDWMTELGTPTSTYPNLPPAPEHYDDFAELARRTAERYPDVRHFVVWNEMKGFWDDEAGNWDAASYTELYNRVYDALKAVDPAIRVGGPYLVIEGTGSADPADPSYATARPITERNRAVLEHWLAHKHGADFIALDRKVQSSHDENTYGRAELLDLTRWFARIARDVRAMTRLPVWFAEDYFVDDPDPRLQAAGLALMLAAEARGGAAVSLRWGPQADASEGIEQNLFTDTRERGGGRPLPAHRVYAGFARSFPPGTRLVRARSASRQVAVHASRRTVMLVNRGASPVTVAIARRAVRLRRFDVRFVSLSRPGG